MTNSDRQQRMAERMLEDESLRGDLEDSAAAALVDWASQRAAASAADPSRPDDEVEEQVRTIRQAARAAALSGETEPRRLIALAEARLAPGVTLSSDAAQPEASRASVKAPESIERSAAPAAQPAATPSQALGAATAAPKVEHVPPASVLPSWPEKPVGPRGRRKRSRLARFLKRIRGER
jgi:hypothetical protein